MIGMAAQTVADCGHLLGDRLIGVVQKPVVGAIEEMLVKRGVEGEVGRDIALLPRGGHALDAV